MKIARPSTAAAIPLASAHGFVGQICSTRRWYPTRNTAIGKTARSCSISICRA